MKLTTILALLISLYFSVCPVIAASPGVTAQAATQPASRPATQPALTAEQKAAKVRDLTRKSLDLLKDNKYAEAEKVIVEALKLDPDHTTNIYNLACIKALNKHPDEAMDLLVRSAEAGFGDFIHIEHDTDLNSLHEMPRYKALIAAKDSYQKKDADRAMASLRKRLGDKYIFEIDPKSKLIFAANTDRQTLVAVKKWLAAQAKSQWTQLFEHHPDQYIAIVLPSGSDYHKMVRMPGVEGIYMHDARMLIAHSLGQVMTHEFTHALHAADLDSLGQEHPIWLVEGIASVYEAGQFDGDKLIPQDNFRLWLIQAAYKHKQLIPLEKLFSFNQRQFMATGNLGYGESYSILLYLYEHDQLRAFYDEFKAGFEKDPTGAHALQKITGKPLNDFDRDWQKWMMARTPPAMNTGPDGAFVGVQFEQGNDGLMIEQVVTQGPADQAGVKPGDVVVGVNNLDIRDQQSLMPLLKSFKPGDGVTFKLRRGESYLQLKLTLGHRPTAERKMAPETGNSARHSADNQTGGVEERIER